MNNKQAGAFGGARQNIKEVYVMLLPSIFGERLFDDFMDFPFRGKMENQMMKTDIKDAGDHFELMMDMPGFRMKTADTSVVRDSQVPAAEASMWERM